MDGGRQVLLPLSGAAPLPRRAQRVGNGELSHNSGESPCGNALLHKPCCLAVSSCPSLGKLWAAGNWFFSSSSGALQGFNPNPMPLEGGRGAACGPRSGLDTHLRTAARAGAATLPATYPAFIRSFTPTYQSPIPYHAAKKVVAAGAGPARRSRRHVRRIRWPCP